MGVLKVGQAGWIGARLHSLRDWAPVQAAHAMGPVQSAFRLGIGAGLVVSLILDGPVITSLMLGSVTHVRRALLPMVAASSAIFAIMVDGFSAGMWKCMWR